MNILNVNSTFGLTNGGGTAERTFQMSHFLAKKNIKCTVLTLDLGLDEKRIKAAYPAKVIAIPCLLERYHLPSLDLLKIFKIVKSADIVHLMGHWSILNAVSYIAIRHYKKAYVVCPAGALPIFGRSRLLKALYNKIIGRSIVKNAHGWIAITSSELSAFAEYGIPAGQITLIPNGVNENDFTYTDIESFRIRMNLSNKPVILFVGRLNKIKGPDLLIKAFALIKGKISGYQLVFIGPDEGMKSNLIQMAKELGVTNSVSFLGFISGDDKSAAYRLASLLVVPSRSEAMSIVALEAGICKTPAMLTDQCGFSEIRAIHKDLEVPANTEGIAKGLVNFFSKPNATKKYGESFYNLVSQKYTWDTATKKYLDLYDKLLVRNLDS